MRSDTSQLAGRRILVAGDHFTRFTIESMLEDLECTVIGSNDDPNDMSSAIKDATLDLAVLVLSDRNPEKEVLTTAEQMVRRGIPTLVYHTCSPYSRPSVPELASLPIIESHFTIQELHDVILRAISKKTTPRKADLPRTGFVTTEGDRRFDLSIYKLQFDQDGEDRIFRLGLSSNSSIHEVLRWAKENELQVLVFPLTLPNFIALQIGEHARRPDASLKTVLVSGSSLLKELNGFALFHSTASPAEFERDTIDGAMSNNSFLTANAVLDCVEDILKNDPSFAKLTNSHHRTKTIEKWSISDYVDAVRNPGRVYKELNISHTKSDELINALLGHIKYDIEVLRPYFSPEDFLKLTEETKRRRLANKPPAAESNLKDLIFFIHGLGGKSKTTWERFPELLLNDPAIAKRFEIDFYSYPTSLVRLPFGSRMPKLQELASGLDTEIRHSKKSPYRKVYLVGHSLGGLIARQYLVNEIKDNKPLRVAGLALFSVPNNGAALASLGEQLSWNHNHLKQLCKEADVLEILNEDWVRFRVQKRVRTKYVVGTQDAIVDRLSAIAFWGNPDIETITGKGHIDIVKPAPGDDLAVRILSSFLLSAE
ncbi:alpha/beta fold hydrolase [Bradyrhizobium sp. ARR65]|uniref:alpha/beta fold hydrolase n=1 Tax=Bradyrhizobium sp. ARR65 TaxID=1040989 RepID=UPI0004637B55|nr:alpha/beta fold hydrolase [Bradyrhizobium sp. ARR65]